MEFKTINTEAEDVTKWIVTNGVGIIIDKTECKNVATLFGQVWWISNDMSGRARVIVTLFESARKLAGITKRHREWTVRRR